MFTHQLVDATARAGVAAAVIGLGLLGTAGIAGATTVPAVPMTPASLPSPDPPPSGGDPNWEGLAQDCHDGSMRSCDSLTDQTAYSDAPVYNNYGFTCGGRVVAPPDMTSWSRCADQFPDTP